MGWRRAFRRCGLLAPLLWLAPPDPAAAATAVDVELVLAADGSGSIDADEFRVQREGYAAAITSAPVLSAIRSGRHGAIAVAYVEWGGAQSQHIIVDWALIRDLGSARQFAEQLLAKPRRAVGYNSISAAIDFAVDEIAGNDFDGANKIIDISGDGPNYGGRPIRAARDDAVAAGITINGLVVKRPGGGYPGPRGEPLEDYFKSDVIGGLGPFVVVADQSRTFAQAIRDKLVLEIAGIGAPVGDLSAADPLPAAAPDQVELPPRAKWRKVRQDRFGR